MSGWGPWRRCRSRSGSPGRAGRRPRRSLSFRSSIAILASAASSPSLAAAHWPISSPALKLSVAKVASAASDRLERRVERDHQDAGIARLLDGRHDRRGVRRRDQDALGAGGDQALDRLDLALVVAVVLAGVGAQLHAELVGLGLAPSFILTKNGLVLVLVIRPTIACAAAAAGRPSAAQHRERGDRRQELGASTSSSDLPDARPAPCRRDCRSRCGSPPDAAGGCRLVAAPRRRLGRNLSARGADAVNK